jgi:hypothetical protein
MAAAPIRSREAIDLPGERHGLQDERTLAEDERNPGKNSRRLPSTYAEA